MECDPLPTTARVRAVKRVILDQKQDSLQEVEGMEEVKVIAEEREQKNIIDFGMDILPSNRANILLQKEYDYGQNNNHIEEKDILDMEEFFKLS